MRFGKDAKTCLKDGVTPEALLQMVLDYQNNEAMQPYYDFSTFGCCRIAPLRRSRPSAHHKRSCNCTKIKNSGSDVLSHHVVKAVGQLGLARPANLRPVLWLNHDLVARRLIAASGECGLTPCTVGGICLAAEKRGCLSRKS